MATTAGASQIKMSYTPAMPYLVEPVTVLNLVNMPIHDHPVGVYCFYCACQDCRMFFGRGTPIRCVDPRTVLPPPRYSYLGLINNMRVAAEKREEERLQKIRAQREAMRATIALHAPKKERVPRDQPKKKGLRQTMKRRRQ